MNSEKALFTSSVHLQEDDTNSTNKLAHRHTGDNVLQFRDDENLEEIILKTKSLNINSQELSEWSQVFIDYINPLILTAISAFVRLYRIDSSNKVVWDEAHFGKFGSHYLKHEFYFDVHPPLGKLLVGLSGFLAGYKGDFKFESGMTYPDDCNYVLMRCFNSLFGILCTPLAYKTGVLLGYSQLTVWFLSLSVIFEMISLTLSKFILLDSMLLFFTVLAYYCLAKVHTLRVTNEILTRKGTKALIFMGFSIGCVCSVKWVGLFVTVLIGIYILYDLLIKSYQLVSTSQLNYKIYVLHWISRILTLIVYPVIIYLLCFKIHFIVLNHSGPGDGSISTLLQASLEGNTIKQGPRSVAFGSMITLRSQGLSPNLIHSHDHLYPEGSQLQQVTTYGFKDANNNFLVEFDVDSGSRGEYAVLEPLANETGNFHTLVRNGDTIRLVHEVTGCFLHAEPIPAPVSRHHFEVSCFADLDTNDLRDEWIIEISEQEKSPSHHFQNEDPEEIHPISTNFRLRHKILGCYLSSTGYSYPSWGFQQGEVACKHAFLKKDKNTWWNVEDHINSKLETPPHQYVAPEPKFWKEFILLNYGMLASNNALVPDPDKFDKLSSEWWEWPFLMTGIRLCAWGATDVKYFLIGNPVVTWSSTLALLLFMFYCLNRAIKFQRQLIHYDVFDKDWNAFLIQGIMPFLGWFLHYFPFIIMGRVKYLHHYVPALYFAILISGFMLETLIYKKANRIMSWLIYGAMYTSVVGSFWYLKDLALGMDGPASTFKHLKILSSWMV
ncbi:protein mannosyltransferase [Scheffersomyces xylosifermentans]|uniref:protein mannosyltransferase n=1 Tax=Scheffersomyces xylosifermentans TaxID=1304137 RepID=UPI00315D8171